MIWNEQATEGKRTSKQKHSAHEVSLLSPAAWVVGEMGGLPLSQQTQGQGHMVAWSHDRSPQG